VQHEAKWNDALQTRDRYGPWRSRISAAPLRNSYALQRIRNTRITLSLKYPIDKLEA